MSGCGMDDETGGFIDNDQFFVFVEDIEGNGLGTQIQGFGGRNFHLDAIARLEVSFLRQADVTIDPDATVFDQVLEARSRQLSQLFGQPAIEAIAFSFDS